MPPGAARGQSAEVARPGALLEDDRHDLGEGGGVDITVRCEPTSDEVVRAFSLGLRRQLTTLYAVLVGVLLVAAAVLFAVGELPLAVAMLVSSVLAPLVGHWWM